MHTTDNDLYMYIYILFFLHMHKKLSVVYLYMYQFDTQILYMYKYFYIASGTNAQLLPLTQKNKRGVAPQQHKDNVTSVALFGRQSSIVQPHIAQS